MAHTPKESEDLLRDATALVARISLETDDWPDPVVIGFRPNGAASLFFGEDPVYQFNRNDELRRSYWHGQRIKAKHGRLISLVRKPHGAQLRFIDCDLGERQTACCVADLIERLGQLRAALASRSIRVIDEVPAQTELLARIRGWLDALPPVPVIADSPRIQ